MKYSILVLLLILVSNCSLNSNSNYWTEDNKQSANNQNKIIKIKEKGNDITLMTTEEYELYLKDHIKKSKYPDINE